MFKKLIIASTLLVTPYIASTIDTQAASVDTTEYNYFNDVVNGSSHAANIYTLYRMGIVNGYGDGVYGTNNDVSRQHIVAMMYRLLGEKSPIVRDTIQFADVPKTHPYYKEITWAYKAGIIDGTVEKGKTVFNPSESMTRAQMSKILVKSFDLKAENDYTFKDVKKSDWAYEYINALYEQNITRLENFTYNPMTNVTRGQLASFLVRTLEKETKYNLGINYVREVPKSTPVTTPTQPSTNQTKINSSWQSFDSGYGFTWKAEVGDKTLHLHGVNSKNEVVANYVKGAGKTLEGIKIGDTRTNVENTLGKYKVTYVEYKDGRVSVVNDTLDKEILTLNKDGKIIRVFIDTLDNNKVTGILSMSADIYKNKYYYTKGTESLRNGYENLMNILINQSRKEKGLPTFKDSNSKYVSLSRNYSQYMINKNYFSHVSPDGKSTLLSRFQDANIPNVYYMGENIAYGQESVIHAHEALMNSAGHRRNILSETYQYTISGVAFKSDATPYYTINFYSTK